MRRIGAGIAIANLLFGFFVVMFPLIKTRPHEVTRDLVKEYRGGFACNTTSRVLMATMQGNFAKFADMQRYIHASFCTRAITVGNRVKIFGGCKFAAYPTAVVVVGKDENGFAFETVKGHPFYPAGIAFNAVDSDGGHVAFSISVNADFANPAMGAGYYVGGSKAEDAVWEHLKQNVGQFCRGKL